MAAFQAAQNELGQSLDRLLGSVEAYPQLKSNENFLTLQSKLAGTENRIAVARRDYNEAVRDYNPRIRTFPEMVGAQLVRGAQPMTPFEATTLGAQEAHNVAYAGVPEDLKSAQWGKRGYVRLNA